MEGITLALGAALLAGSSAALADVQYHRVIWDGDASTEAVIGFSPNGTSNNPYIKYGTSANQNSWSAVYPTATHSFSGLQSHFVRLEGLSPDSAVYYKVCDDNGCSTPLWFKTASEDNQPFVAVAGGDTRTGWTDRKNGNVLIAKLRPLFVMHGGDFTNNNNRSQMEEFLKDWQLTFSDDTINNTAYKRIYPLLPTHGNHENGNYSTLCQVFGVDMDRNNVCDARDTYGAVSISPLLRTYTLNTEFKNSGWSGYANNMNTWLEDDLSGNGQNVTWRIAQYHKPMFPHYSGKSDNTILHNWWADTFYNNDMNLVVESDTHINKLTQPLKPSGDGYVATSGGGTVFIGEGSWGAPARSANDPKAWTIDLSSIQQFKVLTVTQDSIKVRTAQFDASAGSLSREQRALNSVALPGNVNWWSANTVGKVMTLKHASNGLTRLDTSSGGDNTASVSLPAVEDTFVSRSQPNTNFGNSSEGLLADGSDSTYGSMQTLIKWDLSSLDVCKTITAATLELNVTNRSTGAYEIYTSNHDWNENNVTWNSVEANQNHGSLLAQFTPSSTGKWRISVSPSSLNDWMRGNNTGVVIASGGTSNGLDISSREQGNGPVLELTLEDIPGCRSKMTLSPVADAFIASRKANNNYGNSSDGILSDGYDSYFGTLNGIVKWNLSSLSSCTTVEAASIVLNVTNIATRSYDVYAGQRSWSEGTVTWNNIGGVTNQGKHLASFTPSSTGKKTITLDSHALQVINSWKSSNQNNGIVIASGGTSNGLDFSSREQGNGAKLQLTLVNPCQN